MPARDQRLLALSAAVVAALACLLALAGHPELLAYAAPLLGAGAARSRWGATSVRRRSSGCAHGRAGGRAIRGSPRSAPPAIGSARSSRAARRLIAHSLAERGPPAVAAT